MLKNTLNTFFSYYFVCVIAFEDILYTYGEETTDMSEKGKIQYQLLQERGNLPQYGGCWKSAIRRVNDGCRQLSEETQSEIALHLTNCFLEMSGHETYSCEADKKPNLRGICISTMTDRAFNVYTEFYTHAQNICFFLRGQVWHETIAENTVKLGKQLRDSAENQEKLLEIQRESIELQNNMKEFLVYLTEKHKDFDVLSGSFKELQSWLLNELNWLDTFVFYFITSTMIMFFTSLKRTSEARFFMLVMVTLNVVIERFVGLIISHRIVSIFDSHQRYYNLIWFSRYITVIILSLFLLYKFFTYKNYLVDNNNLLEKIYDKLTILNNKIELCFPGHSNGNISVISECAPSINDVYNYDFQKPLTINPLEKPKTHIEKINKTSFEVRYNLRNRSATPEVVQKSI